MSEEKPIATLTIHGVDRMNSFGRGQIADWLMEQAMNLSEDGNNYAGIFWARYFPKKARVMK